MSRNIPNLHGLLSNTKRMIRRFIEKLWSITGALTILESFLPPELSLRKLRKHFLYRLGTILNRHSEMTINEFRLSNGCPNSLFSAAEEYLRNLQSIYEVRRLAVVDGGFSLDSIRGSFCKTERIVPYYGEVIRDSFNGATVWWTISMAPYRRQQTMNVITLTVKSSNMNFFDAYIAHIERNSTVYDTDNDILTVRFHRESILFSHPSTFETLAIEPELKDIILADLERFKQGKDFYARIGRPWKRGYFLYGPPGTGKTSLIAAIANHMKYNIFLLKLSKLEESSEFRDFIERTRPKSVIVIEDLDCSLRQTDNKEMFIEDAWYDTEGEEEEEITERGRENNVTLSGLLNALDGLNSCRAEERIFIFTTNDKDMVDSALLRPGRMDLHISLSFCTFPAFKTLAKNYLKIENHELFPALKEKIESGAQMTPAEIIEIVSGNIKDPHIALRSIISALDAKINR